MASYAMAHLQLDLLLKETGFKATKDQRTRVYLTNSLEEYHPDTGTLFANWLSSEANEANHIKRDTPVMCIIGNPPYSGVSSNKGKWISDLIVDYKYVDGVHFNERKHWLNDDYVKFLRFGQHFIEKNGEGVLAFINPHGFLDNPTFRGMRWNLLKTYDKIYTIDLHGNNKRKETTKEGGIDQNVFDIMQGVSINILIKTGKKKPSELGEVYHYDLFGKRDLKYDFLTNNSISKIPFLQLTPKEPFYFFIPQNDKGIEDFNKGFPISDFFIKNTSGIQTSRDFLVIDSDYNKLETRLNSFLDENKSIDDIREEFFSNATSKKYAKGDSRGWKISEIRPELQKTDFRKFITKISYRPLDKRSICYTRLLVDWTRENIQKEMLRDNISITVGRQGQATGKALWNLLFIQNTISDLNLFYRGGGIVCPLYLYPENTNQKLTEETPKRTPNLNIEIVNEIAENLDLKFTCEKETIENTFAPIDILDYIYAVLHSGNYREKYKEFLKIDFPRVPYPKDKNKFWQLVQLGREIRQIHLLESPIVEDYITTYPKDGDNTITTKVGKKDWELFDEEKRLGRIWINEEQYFDNIPLVAWEFYIGGYQPAQKWLKDRKERILEFDDILHYQKIIVALTETDRLMKEIDKIELV